MLRGVGRQLDLNRWTSEHLWRAIRQTIRAETLTEGQTMEACFNPTKGEILERKELGP